MHKRGGTCGKNQFVKVYFILFCICSFFLCINIFHFSNNSLDTHLPRFGTGCNIFLTASECRTKDIRNGTGHHLYLNLTDNQYLFLRIVHFGSHCTDTTRRTATYDQYITIYCFHFYPLHTVSKNCFLPQRAVLHIYYYFRFILSLPTVASSRSITSSIASYGGL